MSSSYASPSQPARRRSQKQDVSHLLNFRTAAPPPSSSHSFSSSSSRGGKGKHHPKKKNQKQLKETWEENKTRKSLSGFFFLHSSANFSFVLTRRSLTSDSVISSTHNYGGPDVGVRWEAVRMVKCLVPHNEDHNSATAVTSLLDSMAICPICLDEFVAPRITKCGHTFCLPCILRHFYNSSDKTSSTRNISNVSKCPCCFEEIHNDQLRPVLFHSVQLPQNNRTMSFTRLHRTRGCFTPFLPHTGGYQRVEQYSAPSIKDEDAKFSRFNYVDSPMLLDHLSNECTLLETIITKSRSRDGFPLSNEEKAFYHMAIEVVKFHEQRTLREAEEEMHLATIDSNSRLQNPVHAVKLEVLEEYEKKCDDSNNNEGLSESNPAISTEDHMESNHDKKSQQSKKGKRRGRSKSIGDSKKPSFHARPKDLVYLDQNCSHFYQASDGQLCFLSKVNMNCLAAEYSASNPIDNHCLSYTLLPFPDVIEGQIIEVETVHLTPDARKRMSFLSHLPLYTDIQFIEINLNRVLSEETKAKFRDEIEKRRKIRKNKASVEKKADRAAKKKEEDRINALKAAYPTIDPEDEFFHSPPIESTIESLSILDESFGPALEGRSNENNMDSSTNPESERRVTSTTKPSRTPKAPAISFRNACVPKSNFPTLGQATRSNAPNTSASYFPPLSSSAPMTTMKKNNIGGNTKPSWGPMSSPPKTQPEKRVISTEIPVHKVSLGSRVGKGNRKGKKVVLFSTGGQHGY